MNYNHMSTFVSHYFSVTNYNYENQFFALSFYKVKTYT